MQSFYTVFFSPYSNGLDARKSFAVTSSFTNTKTPYRKIFLHTAGREKRNLWTAKQNMQHRLLFNEKNFLSACFRFCFQTSAPLPSAFCSRWLFSTLFLRWKIFISEARSLEPCLFRWGVLLLKQAIRHEDFASKRYAVLLFVQVFWQTILPSSEMNTVADLFGIHCAGHRWIYTQSWFKWIAHFGDFPPPNLSSK